MIDTLFPALSASARADAERLLDAIDAAAPIPSRFRAELPRDVAALSRSLTADRSEREGGYLGKPAGLSAYLRYFLPWNVYRLARLLPSLPLDLKDGDAVADLGSGPLTVPIALWLSRPELRERELEFRCLDRTAKVLEAGAAVFSALSGGASPWRIKTIRGPLGTRLEGPKAALACAANVLNELFWDDRRPVGEQAARQASYLSSLARDDGAILVVEPGIPRSGGFVSALRGALLASGRVPIAPCAHAGACPLPGLKRGAKWCHFAFDTDDAPPRLQRLSAAAGLPKERATLSFLLAARGGPEADGSERVRILSDAFPLPDGSFGRYGCGGRGLFLVAGKGSELRALSSGSSVDVPAAFVPERDEKSGATALRLGGPVRRPAPAERKRPRQR